MTFRNKYLFIVFALAGLTGLIYQLVDHYKYSSSMELQHKFTTITVTHVARNCDCPEWKLYDEEGRAEFIYLEPANLDLPLPEALAGRQDSLVTVKLKGRFFAEKGVPAYYPTSNTKTEPASVFQYTGFELVKPEQQSR